MSQPPPSGNWPDPSGSRDGWPDPSSGGPANPHELPTQHGYPAAQPNYPAGAYSTPSSSPPGYGYQPYPYPPPPGTNGLAIASLVCSLAGIAVCISAPVGAILGHVARKQIRERGEQGDGMALAGIIVGWILTALAVAGCVFYLAVIGWAIGQESSL